MSALPNSWTRTDIADLLELNDNSRPFQQGWSPRCESFPAPDGQWGVLKTTAIQSGDFWDQENKALPDHLSPRPDLEVKVGDLLMTCAGPRSRCGVVCLVDRTRSKLMLSGKMYRFRPRRVVLNAKYLAYFIQTHEAQIAIDRMKTGISDSGLNLTHARFAKLQIPLAPISEQRRIVAKIEELFSELDNGISTLQAARKQLDVYRQAVLKHAFEGGLRRLGGSGVAVPGKLNLPPGWTWVKVSALGAVETGCTPSTKRSDYYGGTIPFFKPTDLNAGDNVVEARNHLTALGLEAARPLPANSILVTCIGATIGKSGIIRVPGAANQQINAVIPSRNFDPDFIYFQIAGPRFQSEIRRNFSATTLPILNKSKFCALPLAVCSLEEQRFISAKLRRSMNALDRVYEELEVQIMRAYMLRQSILKRAFAGRLVEQDPRDESATVLMRRIANEDRAAEHGTPETDRRKRTGT